MAKKIFWIVLLVLLLLAWIWFSGSLGSSGEEMSSTVGYAPVVGSEQELLLDLDNSLDASQVAGLGLELGLRLSPNSPLSGAEQLYRARVSPGKLAGLLARLRGDPRVELAEPDALYSIPPLEESASRFQEPDEKPEPGFPNDPQYRYQWHLDQINLPQVWPTASGRGVVVAVIDTGVAYRDFTDRRSEMVYKQVPDLARTRFVEGYDFVFNRKEALDDHGHGTHVAGTIAQSTHNGVGVAGTAYGATIMPVKVLSAKGYGNVADIAEGIRFATDHGAKVINMSLGGGSSSRILAKAVKYARDHGVVVVCAAGNEGRERVSYPAAYPGAVAVAATQFDRRFTFYSNWGKEVDLAAPGGNTREDQNGDGRPDGVLQNTILPGHPDQSDYLLFMGTSMAAPHVAGAAALVMEAGVTRPDAVEALLKDTAAHPEDKKWDPHYGAGIVDPAAALQRAGTRWGGGKLALGLGLSLLLLGRLRRRGIQVLGPGAGAALGLLLGASGLLFFAPSAGTLAALVPGPLLPLMTHGVPAWDLALLGPAWSATPLFHSALIPVLLAGALFSVPRLRGLLFGLTVGFAAHLLFAAVHGTADLLWIPDTLMAERAWSLLNAGVCLLLASALARK